MVSDVRPSSCERQGLGPVSGGADGIDEAFSPDAGRARHRNDATLEVDLDLGLGIHSMESARDGLRATPAVHLATLIWNMTVLPLGFRHAQMELPIVGRSRASERFRVALGLVAAAIAKVAVVGMGMVVVKILVRMPIIVVEATVIVDRPRSMTPPSALLSRCAIDQNTLRGGVTTGADRDPTGNSDFLTASES
jgi:hypothetical protein